MATATAFICPECKRKFNRAQALGLHRRREHGVMGTSPAALRTRKTKTAAARKTKTRAASKTTTRKTRSARKTTRARRQSVTLNRDALLATLYPNGIPPREEALRDAVAWLDRAEEIAQG